MSKQERFYYGDPRWDPKLEGLPSDRIPEETLRHLARKYAACAECGEQGTYPRSSLASDSLRDELLGLMDTERSVKRKCRVVASLLMGLAEMGEFRP